jgi:hypothetical protein
MLTKEQLQEWDELEKEYLAWPGNTAGREVAVEDMKIHLFKHRHCLRKHVAASMVMSDAIRNGREMAAQTSHI